MTKHLTGKILHVTIKIANQTSKQKKEQPLIANAVINYSITQILHKQHPVQNFNKRKTPLTKLNKLKKLNKKKKI